MKGRSGGATSVALVALLAVAWPAAAQQDEQDWVRNCERQAERSSRSVACQVKPVSTRLASGGLHVDAGRNGGISVRGTAASSGDVAVSARVQAQAGSDERARQLADAVRIHAAGGRVYADGLVAGDGESWTVSYYITVPQRADLELEAVNGPLAIRDVAGRIRAVTTNGPLVLENLAGDVYARAHNGPLTVRLAGSRWDGAGLDAETRNGPISLVMPERYSARLEMSTVNGPFGGDVPGTVTGSQRRGGRLETTLGSGGAPIRVVTTNGPATVRRQ